jgi:N-acetylglucosamine malate deacetylase 2
MTLVIIAAHPDDEALYCGALIARTARSGQEAVTVTLTHGEAGRTLGICEPAQLADVRAAELRAAAQELGAHAAEIFCLPDGEISSRSRGAQRLIRAALTEWRPSIVVTFPPNGVNGHPDHVAVHHATLAALSEIDDHIKPRILLITDPAEFTEPARPGYLPPDEVNRLRLPATETVRADDVIEVKLRALGCYETQARSITKRLRHYTDQILVERFHDLRG